MTNSTVLNLKENIRKYRNGLGLSQEKLSEMADISTDYISAIERGKRTPSIKRLCKIAKALGVEPYKLLM